MKKLALAMGVLLVAGVGVWWLVHTPDVAPPTSDAQPASPLEFAVADDVTAMLADAGSGALEIAVTDEQNQPVAGVRVRLYAQDPGLEARMSCHSCSLPATTCEAPATMRSVAAYVRSPMLEPKFVAEAISDAEGMVRIQAPRVELWVIARATNGLAGTTSIDSEFEPGVPVALELSPPRSLSLAYQGPDSRALAGVKVLAVNTSTLEVTEAMTDSRGVAVVTLARLADEVPWVYAEADGFLPSTERNTDGPVTLQLPRVLNVHTRAGDKPVDAEVTVVDEQHPVTLRSTGGTAHFAELHEGGYSISAKTSAMVAVDTSIELAEAVTDVTIDLRPAGRLMVTVVDAKGEPVQFVDASLGDDNVSVGATTTDKGELLVLGPLAIGNYRLTLSAEGVRPTTRAVDVKPGDTALEITMDVAQKVTGRVLDPDGKPVVGAMIELVENVDSSSTNSAVSSDDGTFEMPLPEPGVWLVRASHDRLGRTELEVKLPGPPVELKLERLAEIEVTLVSQSGARLPKASVSVI